MTQANLHLQELSAFDHFVRIVLDSTTKPHPRTINITQRGVTVNLRKTSQDPHHSFYSGSVSHMGNERKTRFAIKREHDVMRHVDALIAKVVK